MAKRRKRTSKDVPAKGRLRDMADSLWSLAVRKQWGDRCAICGAHKVEAHHLVPRQHEATRYMLRNGIALCARCHQFCRDRSPHQNAAGFLVWLELRHPSRAAWLRDNCRPEFTGTKSVAYYCDTIRSLKGWVDESDYRKIVGTKFSAYLDNDS